MHLPRGVEVYEIDGPFFFGVANKFDDVMREIGERARIRIIRMRKVPFIDATGLNNLQNLCRNSRKEKIQVILSGVNDTVRAKIENSKIPGIIGEENICSNIHLAVDRAIVLSEKREKRDPGNTNLLRMKANPSTAHFYPHQKEMDLLGWDQADVILFREMPTSISFVGTAVMEDCWNDWGCA